MQPPQNPSDLPSPSGYPPPAPFAPAPYGQAPVAPPPQAPRGRVSLDVIGEAWRLLSPNLGNWVLAMVLFFGVRFGISIFQNIIQQIAGRGSSFTPFMIAFTVLMQIVSWIVMQCLLGGLAKLAIATVRTGRAELSEMWSISNVWVSLAFSALLQGFFYLLAAIPAIGVLGTRVFLPFFKAGLFNPATMATGKPPVIPPAVANNLLSGMSLGGLLLLLVVPLTVLFLLTTSLIVDRQVGPWQAIKQSVGALGRNFGSTLLLVFVLGLINIGGVLACCVGYLVSLPLTQIAVALVYRDLFGIESVTPATIVAPPPIANPNF